MKKPGDRKNDENKGPKVWKLTQKEQDYMANVDKQERILAAELGQLRFQARVREDAIVNQLGALAREGKKYLQMIQHGHEIPANVRITYDEKSGELREVK